MKENKRYLIVTGKDASRKNVEKTILEFVGVNGLSKCGLSFAKDKRLILCVNREMVDSVRASFAVSVLDIGVERVSGTIKGLNRLH